ncbi:MAG: PAS domain S-box protein [Deltaproteobacteria bacterium]|nr:MAG: PAS domain S-box protein [Deltaproteobacteria bacterium]
MKKLIKDRVSVADSMVLIGIGLAASYWVLETILNIFTSRDVNFFNQLLGPDINEIWPRIIVFCLFIFFGSHVQFTINNRKKAEEALKESEEKYRTILESIEEGYYEVDLSGNLTFFNDSTARMLGYAKDELIRLKGRQLSSPEKAGNLYRVFEKVHTTGKSANVSECEVIIKDGSTRIFEISVSLMQDNGDQPVGFRGILRDVTEQLKAERENAKLEAQLQEARAATILGLAKLAEYRDEGTGTHLERIREYAKIIAEQMSNHPKYKDYITLEYIEDIFRSSILHDIGKVGVPDAILLKPGRLTAKEFEVIKKHAVLGGDALNAIDSKIEGVSFLTLGKEIAYYHHEKWDGTGYPKGLTNEKIPLSARFVALADVYDALTSKRFYKEAYTHEKAREIIIELKGTHFDPDVVDAFLAREKEFKRICEELHEPETELPEPAEPEQIAARQGQRA